MTFRLRFQRLLDELGQPWTPMFSCDQCRNPVRAEGLAVWNADSPDRLFGGDIALAGFLAVCSTSCEERIRRRVDDVSNWASMPISDVLAALVVGTETAAPVLERIEDADFAKYQLRLGAATDQAAKERNADDGEIA